MATFTDDFNRANSTSLGADWTEIGGTAAVIYGNALACENGWGNVGASCNKVASTDHYAVAQIYTPNINFQVMVRGAQADAMLSGAGSGKTCYHVELSTIGGTGSGAATMYRAVDGAWTSLGTANDTGYVSGDTFRLEAEGTAIRFLRAGSQRIAVTDTQITSGTWTGVKFQGQSSNSAAVDNFTTADITSGTNAPAEASAATA